jgi:hypothetical protein
MGVVFRWVRDPEALGSFQDVADGGIELVLSAVRARD